MIGSHDFFRRKAAQRIALASVILALLIAPLAWYVAKESAEEEVVALASEESNRFLRQFDALELSGPQAQARSVAAANSIVGGLFDIVEIYGPSGDKLAETTTRLGHRLEGKLPKHGKPSYAEPSYESLETRDGEWLLRVFIPLRADGSPTVTGYFEGVRVVPDWQHRAIQLAAFKASMLAALAALLCGVAIYPIVVHLSADNHRKTLEVLDSHISMMEALGRAIAKRDSDTGAHNYRVAWIAARIGEQLGVSGSRMQALIAGSFLHDVGKIGISDTILLKPGKLDEQEMATMRTHVAQGEEIVKGMGWLDGANEVVSAHHEKWDGSGYPRKLAGPAIPLSARIFAIADVFDALSSKRPYKEPMPFSEVMEILRRDTGRHFDPQAMAAFERVVEDIREKLSDGTEQRARELLQGVIRSHFAV